VKADTDGDTDAKRDTDEGGGVLVLNNNRLLVCDAAAIEAPVRPAPLHAKETTPTFESATLYPEHKAEK
jgi:hypothetical protein